MCYACSLDIFQFSFYNDIDEILQRVILFDNYNDQQWEEFPTNCTDKPFRKGVGKCRYVGLLYNGTKFLLTSPRRRGLASVYYGVP